jgi:hypothetical protein
MLTDLPIIVLENINDFLDFSDRSSLKRVCKELNESITLFDFSNPRLEIVNVTHTYSNRVVENDHYIISFGGDHNINFLKCKNGYSFVLKLGLLTHVYDFNLYEEIAPPKKPYKKLITTSDWLKSYRHGVNRSLTKYYDKDQILFTWKIVKN